MHNKCRQYISFFVNLEKNGSIRLPLKAYWCKSGPHFYTLKLYVMKLFNSLHVGESAKIAMIVILVYGAIGLITYFSW